jgi:hypothetical protein
VINSRVTSEDAGKTRNPDTHHLPIKHSFCLILKSRVMSFPSRSVRQNSSPASSAVIFITDVLNFIKAGISYYFSSFFTIMSSLTPI